MVDKEWEKMMKESVERYYGKPKWEMSDEQAKEMAYFLEEKRKRRNTEQRSEFCSR